MSLRIELPYPPRVLHPNARAHWRPKAEAAKKARADAHTLAFQAWGRASTRERAAIILARVPTDAPLQVSVTFHPATRRKYDIDNALAACKSLLDGVADGIAVDDSRFALTLHRGEVVRGGRVVVEIQA